MTRARDIADQQDNLGGAVAPFVGGKNFVANGGFDFWQRGTSFSNPVGAYTADRFCATWSGGTTYTVTQQPSFLTSSRYALRVQRTSGTTSTAMVFLGVGFETVDVIRMQGKTMTWSFYIKAGSNYSPAGGGLGVSFYTGTGTDQGPFVGHTGEVTQINVGQVITTTATRYSYTFTVPTNATSARFNFAMVPSGTAGANDFYEVADMQLEIGSQATPFSRAGGSIGGELALCQRYYFRFANGDVYQPYGAGYAASTTQGIFLINHPVPMRVRPISIDYNSFYTEQFNGLGSTSGVATISNSSPFLTRINITGLSGLTAGYTMFVYSNNNTAGFLGFSAEL